MSTRSEELLRYDTEHILHPLGTVGSNYGFAFESSGGIKLKDSEGKEYIDLSSQLVNVNLGHSRKDIAEAAKAQFDKMQFTTILRGFANVPSIEYAQKLAKVMPKGVDRFLYTMTGADADDCAFKVANLYHKLRGERRYKIISLFNSYHGTLRGTGGATGLGNQMFAEVPPAGVHLHAPNYNCNRCPLHLEYPSCNIECARYLDYLIENEGKDTVSCFIAESEQGAGGFISPPDEYFPMVREICKKHGVLFIADEVMAGFGRTGKMWGIDHWNIIPDMLTMSKAQVCGYLPFATLAISGEVFEVMRGKNLPAGSSECGNPVCCAVASKVLDIMEEENILEHAAKMGQYARERLEKEFLPLPNVDTISGLGLMISFGIVQDKEKKTPITGPQGDEITLLGHKHGLYMRVMGGRVCFAPPLVITKEEMDEAFDRMHTVFDNLKLS
ncbi:aspartate aminotransferase family protein [Chloroflexota bacterium]